MAAGCVLALCSCQQQPAEIISAQPSAAAVACGGEGMPECPLQSWMKSTMQPYQHDNDFKRLADSFDKLAGTAPEGYASWKQIAQAGAEAARNHDAEAVKKTCKSCHNEHRAKFRKERRGVPLF